jgi:hypothetical protein
MAGTADYLVFDADNHLYETRKSLISHLPEQDKRAVDYVEVRGRTKIVVRGTISEYIPNPTFDVVARPGAMEEYFRIGPWGRAAAGSDHVGDARRRATSAAPGGQGGTTCITRHLYGRPCGRGAVCWHRCC